MEESENGARRFCVVKRNVVKNSSLFVNGKRKIDDARGGTRGKFQILGTSDVGGGESY